MVSNQESTWLNWFQYPGEEETMRFELKGLKCCEETVR